MGLLFRSTAFVGSDAHGAAWRELAVPCAARDVAACAELADMLLTRAPVLPWMAQAALDAACTLGDAAACDRADALRAEVRYAGGRDDPATASLVERACADGDNVACGHATLHATSHDEAFDEAAGLRACRAGYRDVCAAVGAHATDDAIALAALVTGCDLPDAILCDAAGAMLAGECGAFVSCPPPDLSRAAELRALACRLDPRMAARCGQPPP